MARVLKAKIRFVYDKEASEWLQEVKGWDKVRLSWVWVRRRHKLIYLPTAMTSKALPDFRHLLLSLEKPPVRWFVFLGIL